MLYLLLKAVLHSLQLDHYIEKILIIFWKLKLIDIVQKLLYDRILDLQEYIKIKLLIYRSTSSHVCIGKFPLKVGSAEVHLH